MKLASIITEEITLDELEHVVRNVYIDQIKKQMKKLRANDKKTHHMFLELKYHSHHRYLFCSKHPIDNMRKEQHIVYH